MGIKGLGLKDKTCWFCGDFSALSRGKVTILVGRACLVPVAYPQPTRFVLSHLYSVISHVIPLRLLQTLNLHRWNCNVFPRSRKITVLNYVRNLSGSGLPSPAVVAARPSHRLRALRPGPIAVGSSAPSMPEAVGVLQQKLRRGAPLMVQFPPVWWW